MAQPEPKRVGRVLESIRRLENVLHHIQPALERHPASSRRPASALRLAEHEDYIDVRMADLAREAVAGDHNPADTAGGYSERAAEPVTAEERAGLDLLVVAVGFEQLAATLIEWADQGPADPPVADFDQACDEIEAALDGLGVPRETGPPPRGSRGSRG